MRALFSSWCDEYYNLKILLIGEIYIKFRFKMIIERRRSRRKNTRARMLDSIYHMALRIVNFEISFLA